MIRLSIPKEPYWLDLPHGVRVFVRPLTTAVYEAARSRSWRMAREIAEEHADIRSAGGDVTGLPDLSDNDAVTGLSQLLFAQALARSAITRWEGVLGADDLPADVTEQAVADLMLIPRMAEAFVVSYTDTHEAVLAEGNASRPAPNGTSGAGRNTAEGAGKTTSPAPAVADQTTASDAHTTSTPRKRKRAGKPGISSSPPQGQAA
ncbi:conserved protein of unknown function [Magnetospirillum sp. XM-1]|uniref:hypothetical protein n=1 Tax=Magnetospirillum sp. XM-1 TaxID=1663591 RepID=UPI00073DF5AB|nr:hypothetical protein [Magnetospirillum sp. XM-1]CUW39673.1 conserved protein of unknown function [Magnetospirillum sp. XM-1]